MALYRRSKWYWTHFYVNGQRHRMPLRTRDWREAQAREKELITQASNGKLAPSSQQFARLAFSQTADRYLKHRRVEVSERTCQTDADKMKPLRSFFTGTRLSQISADAIRSYQAHRHAAGRHPRTINHEVKLLLRLLRRARIPHPDVKMLPVPRSPVRVLAQEEKLRLFQTASSNPDWKTAYSAALLTANATLRPSGLRAIRWQDVDARERTVMIRHGKTEASVRIVPLNAEAWSAICALRMRAQALGTDAPEHYVFHRLWPKVDGTKPMKSWRSAWRSLRKAAGLPNLRYYDLRHQCITEMLEAGVPEGVIREVAGHVDPAMTRWYSHPRLAAKRAAVEAISGVVTTQSTTQKALPEDLAEPKLLKEVARLGRFERPTSGSGDLRRVCM
jgi:integrase